MKASEIRKHVQSQFKRIARLDDATKYYEKQKNALKAIKDTSWFQEIKDYWFRELDSCNEKLSKVDAHNVSKVASLQGQMNNARSFLEFLDNMTE